MRARGAFLRFVMGVSLLCLNPAPASAWTEPLAPLGFMAGFEADGDVVTTAAYTAYRLDPIFGKVRWTSPIPGSNTFYDLNVLDGSGNLFVGGATNDLSPRRVGVAKLDTCLLYTSPSPRDS